VDRRARQRLVQSALNALVVLAADQNVIEQRHAPRYRPCQPCSHIRAYDSVQGVGARPHRLGVIRRRVLPLIPQATHIDAVDFKGQSQCTQQGIVETQISTAAGGRDGQPGGALGLRTRDRPPQPPRQCRDGTALVDLACRIGSRGGGETIAIAQGLIDAARPVAPVGHVLSHEFATIRLAEDRMIHTRTRVKPAERVRRYADALAAALTLQMLKSVSGAS
jgi:hypothetical protein